MRKCSYKKIGFFFRYLESAYTNLDFLTYDVASFEKNKKMMEGRMSMNDIKPVRGGQFIPPLLEPECIRVQKVFDWTVTQTQDQRDITPPPECTQPIAYAIASGQLVTVTCTAPTPDLTSPIVPSPAPLFCPVDMLCCLEIGRENVTLTDGTQAQLVSLVSSIPLHIVVTANGHIICEFDTHVKIFQKDVLCAPAGTHVLCRVTQIICDAVLLNENQIVVNVSICKEIQVEAEVKLEVIAKFCHPRAPIPANILPLACPPIGVFPPQCPTIFPTVNCECSVTGTATGEFYIPIPLDALGLSIVAATLNINVCPNCQATGSTITGSLTVLQVLGISILTIPLTSTVVNPPICADGITTITGFLTLTVDGLVGMAIPFTLTIDKLTNTATLTLSILGIPVTITPLSAAGVTVTSCVGR